MNEIWSLCCFPSSPPLSSQTGWGTDYGLGLVLGCHSFLPTTSEMLDWLGSISMGMMSFQVRWETVTFIRVWVQGHINPALAPQSGRIHPSHRPTPFTAKQVINSSCPNMSGIYSPSLSRISRERLGALLLTEPTEQAVVVVDVRDSGGSFGWISPPIPIIECWPVFSKTTSEVISNLHATPHRKQLITRTLHVSSRGPRRSFFIVLSRSSVAPALLWNTSANERNCLGQICQSVLPPAALVMGRWGGEIKMEGRKNRRFMCLMGGLSNGRKSTVTLNFAVWE